ncbi:hypothetical protein RB595_005235 [Gaeumannomyces hyphopodioides]
MSLYKILLALTALAAIASGFPQSQVASQPQSMADYLARTSMMTYTVQTTMGEYTGPVAVVSQSTYFVSPAPTTALSANLTHATAPMLNGTRAGITAKVSSPSKASSSPSSSATTSSAPSPTETWGELKRVPTVHECRRDWACCKGACLIGSWFTFGTSCCRFRVNSPAARCIFRFVDIWSNKPFPSPFFLSSGLSSPQGRLCLGILRAACNRGTSYPHFTVEAANGTVKILGMTQPRRLCGDECIGVFFFFFFVTAAAGLIIV